MFNSEKARERSESVDIMCVQYFVARETEEVSECRAYICRNVVSRYAEDENWQRVMHNSMAVACEKEVIRQQVCWKHVCGLKKRYG